MTVADIVTVTVTVTLTAELLFVCLSANFSIWLLFLSKSRTVLWCHTDTQNSHITSMFSGNWLSQMETAKIDKFLNKKLYENNWQQWNIRFTAVCNRYWSVHVRADVNKILVLGDARYLYQSCRRWASSQIGSILRSVFHTAAPLKWTH